MKYINKNTGNIIDGATYRQLSATVQLDYVYMASEAPVVQKSEVHHTSDSMSLGDGIACAVVAPLAVFCAFFD